MLNEARGTSAMGCFHVSIHDVAPIHRGALDRLLTALRPRVGSCLSVAVVPAWRGAPLEAARDRGWAADLGADELLVHGLTHAVGPGRRLRPEARALAWLTGGANELDALSRGEAAAALERARDRVAEVFERAPAGLVPPAWRLGSLAAADVWRAGLALLVGLSRVIAVDGRARALATSSWDVGPTALAPLGEAVGAVLSIATRGAAVPCAVLHPRDVERGLAGRALARIDAWLAAGRRPATLTALIAEAR
jgi:predicted deacetylase